MRTYVVQAGDSPAKIAIQYAQCPKCAADLVAVNPQKPAVRYPNGFLTFSSLHVGERLNLPDKWFNGALDALPKEYFDALPAMPGSGPQNSYLPQMATQAGGVGQAPGYMQRPAMGYTPRPTAGYGSARPSAGYTPRQAVTACEAWTYGLTVNVGQTLFLAFNQYVSVAAMQRAASTPLTATGASATVNGSLYFFKPVLLNTPAGVIWRQVQIFFCSRMLSQSARPAHLLGLRGAIGVGANPPPPVPPPDYSAGIPVPNGPSQATSADFIPEHNYDLVVWPIPQSQAVTSAPGLILQHLGFDVSTLTYNDPASGGDGSYSANATYVGATDYVPDPSDGLSILVFYQGSQTVGGPPYILMTAGTATVPGNQLVVLPPSGQTWVSLTLDGNIPVPITGPTDPLLVQIGGAGQATTGQLVAVTQLTAPIPLIQGSTPADILYNYLVSNGCNCDANTAHPQAQYVADFQSSIGSNPPSGYYGPLTQGSLQIALNQEGNSGFVAPPSCYGTDQQVKGQFPSCTAYPSPNGQQTTTLNVTVQGGANPSGKLAFLSGEVVRGAKSNVTANVGAEYDDTLSQGWGVLLLDNATTPFLIGEMIHGQQSNGSATIAYQYPVVMNDPNAGTLGVTSIVDNGSVQQLPYNAQPGDKLALTLRPMMDAQGNIADVTDILLSYGFAPADLYVGVQNADCTWPITATNNTGNPVFIDAQMTDNTTGASMWVTGLTANGLVIATPPPPAQQIGGPIMRACHAFSFTYVPKYCPVVTGGAFDPTQGLAQLGFTNFTPPTSGPDALGQYTVDGVWELGDGFQLPTSKSLTITGYIDHGPATNVQSGNCATSLPYTLQPGDSVNLIVRPIAVPGQPMSNPVAILASLGFANIAPAATYSDCTWSMTAIYTGGASPVPGSPPGKPLQVTDPMVSPSVGAMWIVGMSVNSTTIKDANWAPLTEIPVDLDQCSAYSILFTFDVCPALTGAPGSWDPSTAVQAILPGFKVAPGPNEYGEWTASGVWTGASVKALAGSGGIHFTLLVNFGASQGCTVTPPGCPTGQIADTITKACVAPCADGSAPANGVCPPPVKGTGPCPTGQVRDTQTGVCVASCPGGGAPTNGVCPVVAPAAPASSVGTVVAVGAAVVILGGVTYLALT